MNFCPNAGCRYWPAHWMRFCPKCGTSLLDDAHTTVTLPPPRVCASSSGAVSNRDRTDAQVHGVEDGTARSLFLDQLSLDEAA